MCRSYDRFEDEDFVHLAALAKQDLADFIGRHPHHATLADRVLLVALCQGAALHHLDGTTGVKDFDVWTFFSDDGRSPRFPYRRPTRSARVVYEGPRFQTSMKKVDCLGRTLDVEPDADPVGAVTDYLQSRRTDTARHLSQKAVVALAPAPLRGRVLWRPAGIA